MEDQEGPRANVLGCVNLLAEGVLVPEEKAKLLAMAEAKPVP